MKISMLFALRLIEWIPLCLLHCLCRKFCTPLIGMHCKRSSQCISRTAFFRSHSFSRGVRRHRRRCRRSCKIKCKMYDDANLPACFLHHFGTIETADLAECLIAIDYWILNDLSICQQERTIRCKKNKTKTRKISIQ